MSRPPYDSAVTPGRRSLGVRCVIATSVAVGGASGPSMDSLTADVDRHSKTIQLWNLDGCVARELGLPLVHHYRVFQKGTSHVSLRGDYLTRLRTFVTQSAAMSRWGQHNDTGQSSPAPDSAGCVCRRPILAPAAVDAVCRGNNRSLNNCGSTFINMGMQRLFQ